jgi:chemotaxis methyl-accepting protein methylase
MPYVNNNVLSTPSAGVELPELQMLLEKVYLESGYDFRNYRTGTISRRMARRLYATGKGTYQDYMCFLDAHPEEYQQLVEDLTVKVSGFFRRQQAFQKLAEDMMTELVLRREAMPRKQLSFWSAACACGEEPYSIAMTAARVLGKRLPDYEVSVYASDISLWALARAQAGIYPSRCFQEIPETMWGSYVTHSGETYLIRPEIRQMVKFIHLDLASVMIPPVRNVDCIFCCNVLIYWQKQLQERVLKMLYEALAANGYLVLAEVETPSGYLLERLTCIDYRNKIYQKKD